MLDRVLPGRDGLEVLRGIRAAKPALPVIMLTARSEVADKVAGLDAGATDYMTKPFSVEELLARVRAHLRAPPRSRTRRIWMRPGSTVDLLAREVTRDGRPVRLSAKEFELLVHFMRHPNQVLSREQLLSGVWGYDFEPETNVVEVYVGYLRKKLGADGRPAPIETMRSVGYRLLRAVTRLGGLRPRITLLVTAVVACLLLVAFVALYRETASKLSGRTDRGAAPGHGALRAAILAARDADDRSRRRASTSAAQPFRRHDAGCCSSRLRGHAGDQRARVSTRTRDGDRDDRRRRAAREARRAARAVLGAPPGLHRRVLPGVGDGAAARERRAGQGRARVAVRCGRADEPIERARTRCSRGVPARRGARPARRARRRAARRVARRAPLRRMARVAERGGRGRPQAADGLTGRDDEVRVLAHAFDRCSTGSRTRSTRQGAFVADASHELRTPLTVVRGQLEVLAMDEDPPAEEVRHVERLVAHAEIERMERLVEDLLVLARAERARGSCAEPIDLRRSSRDVLEGLAPTADGASSSGSAPDRLDADPDRLAQALRNLLRNAIVHTERGGLVRLQLPGPPTIASGSSSTTTGPAIPPRPATAGLRSLPPPRRLARRRRGGAGLGLAIVRAIAEAHGGRIEIADSPAGGARVSLVLPLGAAAVSRRRPR